MQKPTFLHERVHKSGEHIDADMENVAGEVSADRACVGELNGLLEEVGDGRSGYVEGAVFIGNGDPLDTASRGKLGNGKSRRVKVGEVKASRKRQTYGYWGLVVQWVDYDNRFSSTLSLMNLKYISVLNSVI
jgi:hypothetical protein